LRRARRYLRLLTAGKGWALAGRLLARLPGGRPVVTLPALPAEPQARPIRLFEGGRPVRLLVAGASLRLEGAPISQLDLVTALAADGTFHPVVAAVEGGGLEREYRVRGIPVRTGLPGLSGIYDQGDFTRAAQDIAALLAAERIDLVLAVTALTAPTVEAARLAGIPAVWNLREGLPPHQAFRPFGPAVAARSLASMRHATVVAFVAEASRAQWEPLDDGRFRTIANTLPPERVAALQQGDRAALRHSLGVHPHDLLVLMPGTICARKGQRDLTAAARRLPRDAMARLRFVLVGEAADTGYARALSRDLRDLPPGVFRLVPPTLDIAPWYRAADAMVMCSRTESAPRVVLEALAAALPIVATRVAGVPAQLGDSGAALFYSPGDVAALADHLSRIASSPPLRDELALRARHHFDAVNDFAGMVARYRSLLLAAARGTQPP